MVRSLSSEKKEAFFRVALKLFVANGVQNTSTAEIAREAGSAAGTLFLYFQTKQDLINELVLKISEEQSEYINTLLSAPLSIQDAFLAIWNGSIDWFLRNLEAYQFVQQIRDTSIIPESIIQETAKHLSYYYIVCQKGAEAGIIKPYPIEITGGFLYQDIVAMMSLLKTEPDPIKREEYTRIGFDIFWNGLKPDRSN